MESHLIKLLCYKMLPMPVDLHMVSKHFTQHYIQKLCLNLTIGNETVLPKNPQNSCSKAGASELRLVIFIRSCCLLLPHSPTLHTSGKKLFPVLFSLIQLSVIHVSLVVAYIIAAVGCSMLPLT